MRYCHKRFHLPIYIYYTIKCCVRKYVCTYIVWPIGPASYFSQFLSFLAYLMKTKIFPTILNTFTIIGQFFLLQNFALFITISSKLLYFYPIFLLTLLLRSSKSTILCLFFLVRNFLFLIEELTSLFLLDTITVCCQPYF